MTCDCSIARAAALANCTGWSCAANTRRKLPSTASSISRSKRASIVGQLSVILTLAGLASGPAPAACQQPHHLAELGFGRSTQAWIGQQLRHRGERLVPAAEIEQRRWSVTSECQQLVGLALSRAERGGDSHHHRAARQRRPLR